MADEIANQIDIASCFPCNAFWSDAIVMTKLAIAGGIRGPILYEVMPVEVILGKLIPEEVSRVEGSLV